MGRYRKAAEAAADLTNKQLAGRLAALAPISGDRLQELLPYKRDKEAFIQLMRVVEDEADEENQIAYLGENLATAGKVALKVLRAFA
jgi:hypothetical protein